MSKGRPEDGDRVRVAKTSTHPSRWGTVIGVVTSPGLSYEVRFDDARVELLLPGSILEHRTPDKTTTCPSCGDACGTDNCGAAAGNRCCDDCPTLKDLY